jgi:hypothetical protein
MEAGEEGFSIERGKPSEGFAALLGEAIFQDAGQTYSFCTNVYILGKDPKTGQVRILSRPWSVESP